MKMTLVREPSERGRTFGVLFVNGRYQCFTLEDEQRMTKIAGVTCIPAGTYKVSITYSPKFDRRLPLIHDVPGFTGIRIHTGNTASDTEGCILPGLGRQGDAIVLSKPAFDQLFALIEKADLAKELITIKVMDPMEA
jgi:hypothetical protein